MMQEFLSSTMMNYSQRAETNARTSISPGSLEGRWCPTEAHLPGDLAPLWVSGLPREWLLILLASWNKEIAEPRPDLSKPQWAPSSSTWEGATWRICTEPHRGVQRQARVSGSDDELGRSPTQKLISLKCCITGIKGQVSSNQHHNKEKK